MIVEVRTYRVKPGRRDEFLRVFQSRSVPVHRSYGMGIVGPLLDVEKPDSIVWLRLFPSAQERERIRAEFYAGKEYNEELEPVLVPMLEGYEIAVCEAAPGYVFDCPG